MAMIDYMWDHRRLARHEYDAYTAEVAWLRLAETLNRTGSVKSVEKWKVTWRDLKRKASREVHLAAENNKNPSEAALKIREIIEEPDDGNPKQPRTLKMSPSLSHSVFHEESYQSQELSETIDQEQSQEYLESSEGRVSPSSLDLEAIDCTPDFSSDSSPPNSPTPNRWLIKLRGNQEQINTLVDCMAINSGMAFGNQTTPKKMADWMRLRQLLNRIGPAKRTAAWQQSWRDLKRKALERNKISTKSNTPLTKKILEIISAYNEGRHTNDNSSADGDAQLRLPPQVKHLIHQETVLNVPPRQDGHASANTVSTLNSVPLQQSRQRFKPKTRSTNNQILALVDYMDKHPALAVAKSVAGDTQCPYAAEWRRLSYSLNRISTAKRSTMAWKRTWQDLKKTAKKDPDKERNSHLNKRILEILERGATAQNDTEINMETEDVLPFSADYDQISDQLSLGQHSDRSSRVRSENEDLQLDQKLIPGKITHCTNAQKHALVDYMSTHLALATSRFFKGLGSDPHYAEWRQLSKYLNKIGTAKTTISWKRTWRDLKCSVLKKKWANKTLLGLDRRILDISEKDVTDLYNETAQEFDSLPDPTTGMPVLYLQSPEHTSQPDFVFCDEDRSQGDPGNQEPQNNPNRKDTIQESPGRQSEMSLERQSLEEMSPSQQSPEMSPDQRIFGTESPAQRSERDSLAQSENEKIPKDVSMKTRRARCTSNQIKALVNHMARHPHLARGICLYNTNEHDPKQEKWRRLSRYLNQIDRSVLAKSVNRWKSTWRSLVINARRKDRKRSKWNDMISRKIIQILDGNKPKSNGKRVEHLVTKPTENYVYLPSPSSGVISLPDPLKSEQDEDFEQNQDRNTPTTNRRNRRRSSSIQLRALADYMISHPELALNHCKLNAMTPAWVRITRHLNKIGPARSSDAWRQTWKDLKLRVTSRARFKKTSNTLEGFREKRIMKLIGLPSPSHLPDTDCETYYTQMKATLKRRIRSINDSYTGGGAPKGGELTVTEQRLQAVLGSGFATKLPNVAIDPGFNSDDDKEDEPRESVEEYNTKRQPEVALGPRAPSPRSVLYNLAEILARNSPNDRPENKRNNKTPTAETTSSVSNETNNILREIVQELKRSNELKTEQNGYLIELLTQLKTPTCIDARQDTDITHIADSQTDIHATDIQKQEVNAQDEMSHFNEMNEDRCIEVDTMPAKRTPVIRPVALSSLTTVNTPGPQLQRVKVHSILKSEPKNTARRLVRLKDGTMVLVPNGMKPQVRPNEDNNADQLYVVCKRR